MGNKKKREKRKREKRKRNMAANNRNYNLRPKLRQRIPVYENFGYDFLPASNYWNYPYHDYYYGQRVPSWSPMYATQRRGRGNYYPRRRPYYQNKSWTGKDFAKKELTTSGTPDKKNKDDIKNVQPGKQNAKQEKNKKKEKNDYKKRNTPKFVEKIKNEQKTISISPKTNEKEASKGKQAKRSPKGKQAKRSPKGKQGSPKRKQGKPSPKRTKGKPSPKRKKAKLSPKEKKEKPLTFPQRERRNAMNNAHIELNRVFTNKFERNVEGIVLQVQVNKTDQYNYIGKILEPYARDVNAIRVKYLTFRVKKRKATKIFLQFNTKEALQRCLQNLPAWAKAREWAETPRAKESPTVSMDKSIDISRSPMLPLQSVFPLTPTSPSKTTKIWDVTMKDKNTETKKKSPSQAKKKKGKKKSPKQARKKVSEQAIDTTKELFTKLNLSPKEREQVSTFLRNLASDVKN